MVGIAGVQEPSRLLFRYLHTLHFACITLTDRRYADRLPMCSRLAISHPSDILPCYLIELMLQFLYLYILLAIAVEYGLFTIPQHLAVPTGWAVMIIVHADAGAGAWSEG